MNTNVISCHYTLHFKNYFEVIWMILGSCGLYGSSNITLQHLKVINCKRLHAFPLLDKQRMCSQVQIPGMIKSGMFVEKGWQVIIACVVQSLRCFLMECQERQMAFFSYVWFLCILQGSISIRDFHLLPIICHDAYWKKQRRTPALKLSFRLSQVFVYKNP